MRRWLILPAALLAVVATIVRPAPTAAEFPQRSAPTTTPSDDGTIREFVEVTNGRDDDGDGEPDRYQLDIVRPDTDEAVPIILVQSPYWDAPGRGREEETRVRAGGVVTRLPLFYDNWFVPRGYAVVALDVPETGTPGDGCFDDLGPVSTSVATAALDWPSGTGPATDAAGAPVTANWSSGRVAMIGKSADGGLAVAAAATDHPALEAVVPIAAPTSPLAHNTSGGLLVGYIPPDEPFGPACATFHEAHLAAWGDGVTYTEFWQARDPVAAGATYSAATFLVAGVADLNVPTQQTALLWELLVAQDVLRRLWLHQGGHLDPFDVRRAEWVDALTPFLDHHLRDQDNGAEHDPVVTVQDADGSWHDLADWPPDGPVSTWAWMAPSCHRILRRRSPSRPPASSPATPPTNRRRRSWVSSTSGSATSAKSGRTAGRPSRRR